MRFSHWLAGSSNRQPRPLIGPYICNTFADLSVTANSTAPILCVYGCISADFVLNYGHKSRFNLLRSVVFELFVMLMGGGGLVGWALLWNYDLLCWLFPLAAGCGVWCDGYDSDQWYQDWFWLDNIRARLEERRPSVHWWLAILTLMYNFFRGPVNQDWKENRVSE